MSRPVGLNVPCGRSLTMTFTVLPGPPPGLKRIWSLPGRARDDQVPQAGVLRVCLLRQHGTVLEADGDKLAPDVVLLVRAGLHVDRAAGGDGIDAALDAAAGLGHVDVVRRRKLTSPPPPAFRASKILSLMR